MGAGREKGSREARNHYFELKTSFQQKPDKIVPLCDLQNKKLLYLFHILWKISFFLISFEAINMSCIFKAIYTACVFANFFTFAI